MVMRKKKAMGKMKVAMGVGSVLLCNGKLMDGGRGRRTRSRRSTRRLGVRNVVRNCTSDLSPMDPPVLGEAPYPDLYPTLYNKR